MFDYTYTMAHTIAMIVGLRMINNRQPTYSSEYLRHRKYEFLLEHGADSKKDQKWFDHEIKRRLKKRLKMERNKSREMARHVKKREKIRLKSMERNKRADERLKEINRHNRELDKIRIKFEYL